MAIKDIKGIKLNEPMKKHTTFRTGGVADFLYEPKTYEDIKNALLLAKEENIPVTIIGNGSNLLVKDGVVTLAIYYGGPNGYEERDALLAFFRNLDHKTYSVLYQEFINYPNEAPLLVCITKTK